MERRRVQHHIRSNWNAKTANHPFLGVDCVQLTTSSNTYRMTQEQYATLWLRSSLECRRVPKDERLVP
jgi:hypothetical protein